MMTETMMMRAEEMLRERQSQRRWLIVFLSLAMFVATSVISTLSRAGEAMTRVERVLVCTCESGTVAHIHNDDCYDEFGALVCSLAELDGHLHEENCYDENGELICEIAEGEYFHEHNAYCRDDQGNLHGWHPESSGRAFYKVRVFDGAY